MHIQKEVNPALNTVTAYGDDYIEINKTRHTQSIYFTPKGKFMILVFKAHLILLQSFYKRSRD